MGSRLIAFGLLMLATTAPALPQKAAPLQQVIGGIAAGADSAGRRSAITARLEAAGIPFQLEEFVDRRMRKGVNIIAALPGNASKTLLLGAHYDRVPVGQGVLDNAASCAILLDLLTTFKTNPLRSHALIAVFFDLEEGGLSGSQAYFQDRPARPLPAYALNLDIFGYGDAIFATTSQPQGKLNGALQQAGKELGIPVRMESPALYPDSDHRSMMSAGVETLGISLLDAGEIDDILAVLKGASKSLPPVLTTIHTPKDTLASIRPEEIEKGIPLLERIIRLADEN